MFDDNFEEITGLDHDTDSEVPKNLQISPKYFGM